MRLQRLLPVISMVFMLLCFVPSLFFAQEVHNDPAWQVLDRARIAFENGELGTALALGEEARSLHTAAYLDYYAKLSEAVSQKVLRASGGEIDAVRALLLNRNEKEAVTIIDMVLTFHDKRFFGNNFDELSNWLKKRAIYPEADILCGDVYAAEGEYSLAMNHYLLAWENRELLRIPEIRISLCYKMADVEMIRGNYGAQEQYLLLVLTEDPLYGTPDKQSPSLKAIIRTLESSDNCDKFFALYRHKNIAVLKAYQDLTKFYYYRSGKRLDRALSTAAVSAVLSVSILDDYVARKRIDYQFTTFRDLLQKVSVYPDIIEEADRRNIWNTFIDLAMILYDRQQYGVSGSILNDLSRYCPDSSVSAKAENMLREKAN